MLRRKKETGEFLKAVNFAEKLGNLDGKLSGLKDAVNELTKEIEQRDDRRHEEINDTETRIMNHVRDKEESLTGSIKELKKGQTRNLLIILTALFGNTGVQAIPEEHTQSFIEFLSALL